MTELATPDAAAVAEERFLAELRDRVAWQAHQAAVQRTQASPPPAEPVDVLDVLELMGIVERNSDEPRAAEWRAFLEELSFLADEGGRLPAALERLVRVVLADLL